MYDLTQEDNGEYITRDKNGLVLDTFNIVVIGEYLWRVFAPTYLLLFATAVNSVYIHILSDFIMVL